MQTTTIRHQGIEKWETQTTHRHLLRRGRQLAVKGPRQSSSLLFYVSVALPVALQVARSLVGVSESF